MDLPPALAALPGRSWRSTPPEAAEPELAVLVARAKAGDREAYTVLYRRYREEIYRFALIRLGEREAAEDATQSVFLRALAALPTCREPNAFAGWLFSIARHEVLDQLRARRHRADPLPDDPIWPDASPGPEDAALRGEATRVLLAAREKCLTERERELFDLLLTELNDKQIAAVLGRNHGAVRTAHWRLLSKLRECLGTPPGQPRGGAVHA